MKTLITGGAGYIGSTIASACMRRNIQPIILDNLSTGRREFVDDLSFYEGEINDGRLIDQIFIDHPDIESVIHCAARIVVPESVSDPLGYYRTNVSQSVELFDHLMRNGCSRILYSSSASVYQPNEDLTVDESSPLDPKSPYSRTKMMVECILQDVAATGGLRAISMRYFNPVGADPQLRTGQQSIAPTHAMGKLLEAYGSGSPFSITGTDWPTRDGSAMRDYIHVWDLARAHVAALLAIDRLLTPDRPYLVLNVGTGTGTTVRELVAAFQEVARIEGGVVESGARDGDVIGCYSRSDRALRLLGWTAQLSLGDAVRHALDWHHRRPDVLGQ